MNRLTTLAAIAVALFFLIPDANAACTTQVVNFAGSHITYSGSCEDDDEVLITTGDMTQYDYCWLSSSTGVVDVLVSLDGTTYTTAALSLGDFGAITTVPVIVTVAGRMYAFPQKFRKIKVLQNGATDAAAVLLCAKNS